MISPRLTALFSALLALPLLAAPVANNNDAGSGSLRQAIADATPGDTITFDGSLDGGTITLTTGQLLIAKNLTIDASALPNGLTIDANGSVTNHRVLQVTAGSTVILSHLTLTNGAVSGSFPGNSGGAIYNLGTLTLNNSTLSGNSSDSGDGGGIYNDGYGSGTAILTLNNSTLSGNSADWGGGISNDGGSGGNATITINHSSISDNSATSRGGGIYNYGRDGTALITLNNSTLSNNSAQDCGGIYNDGSNSGMATLALNNSTISNNSTQTNGGGIYNNGDRGTAILTLHNSTLSDNSADFGGGIYNDGSPSGTATLTLHNSTLSDNSAEYGGGIYNNGIGGTATITLNNSIVAANTSVVSSPDILNDLGTVTPTGVNLLTDLSGSDLSPDPTIIVAPPLLAPLGHYGGPTQTMHPLEGSPAIDAATSTPRPGDGTDARGFTGSVGATIDIGAVEAGPALLVTTTTDSGVGSLRDQLTVATTPGHRILFDPATFPATITLSGDELVLNNKTVFLDASAFTTSPGVTISGNNNSRIFRSLDGTSLALHSLTLTNAATAGAGAAISNQATATLTLCNTTLSGNTAALGGGGLQNQGILLAVNTTISGNTCSDFGGGLINQTSAHSATLRHCTLSGNTSGAGGGGIQNNSLLTLQNTIVGNNHNDPSGANSPNDLQGPGTNHLQGVNIIETLASGTLSGPGTALNLAPLLAPLGHYGGPTQTRPPLPGSPAIEGSLTTTLPTDQLGNPRPSGSLPDIGAVEALPLATLGLPSTDSDTIPDLLEGPDSSYPHLDPSNDDSALDTDGDGSTDAEEIANMTNLYDPSDFFRVLSFTKAAGFDPLTNPVFEITLPTFPGLDYQLEHQSDLSSPFIGLDSPTTATDFMTTIEGSLDSGKDFVRAVRK